MFKTTFNSCMVCARNKARRHKPYGELQPLPVPDRPWSSLSMDFIEELPPSKNFNSILVIVCRFSKMAIFIPTSTTIRTKDLADIFLHHVYSKHGLPSDIVSDRGPKFASKFWQTFCSKLKIDRKLSTAYHPQTDGQTERDQSISRTVHSNLLHLPAGRLGRMASSRRSQLNQSDHTSTGVSPFFANYGYHPSFEVVDGLEVSTPGRRYVEDLAAIHDSIRATLHKAQADQKRFADQRRTSNHKIEVGKQVLLNSKNIRTTRPTRKFAERMLGPFEVIQEVSPVAFKLRLPQSMSKIHPVFHVSLLEVVPPSEIPGRTLETSSACRS